MYLHTGLIHPKLGNHLGRLEILGTMHPDSSQIVARIDACI